MIDSKCLLAFAQDANFIAMDEERVVFHVASVTAINRQVAEGALARVGIDRPPQSFETFRLHFASDAR